MSLNKDSMVLALCNSLLILLICNLISPLGVFAESKKGPVGCTPIAGSAPSSKSDIPGEIRCCQTSTDSEGIEITTCTVCDDTNPPSNCTHPFTIREGSVASNIGTVQPSTTPPPPSNETHINNQPGNIGTMQPLTTTCPNGLTSNVNGKCINTINPNQNLQTMKIQ